MSIDNFNHTIDAWINALDQYDCTDLSVKPSPASWSLGQLYTHLINDTHYYIEQIKICISTNNNMNEESSPGAKKLFLNNGFPDEKIEGAPGNDSIPQPGNKEDLMHCLLKLKEDMNAIKILITQSPYKGKTKHPGLNYFNADEWFRFADMHFRHHVKQKKRIDDFLRASGY